jgi:hypothetical protein
MATFPFHMPISFTKRSAKSRRTWASLVANIVEEMNHA